MKTLKIAAIAILVTAGACATKFETLLTSNDVEAKYAAAMNYYQNKKFTRAAQLFESMAILTNGTARDDTVQFYWGLSNYRNKDFYTAEGNFASFVQNFPTSPFASDAEFYRLDCMYRATYRYELDQMPTRSCLAAIAEYEREHPGDEAHLAACAEMKHDLQDRLDRKDFEAGKLYYRMEDYLAAQVKLRNVLKNNADNFYREDVLYYTAMASYNYARLSVPNKRRDRYLVFSDDYLNFVGEYPESHYRKELDGLYRKVQNILGKDAPDAPDQAE